MTTINPSAIPTIAPTVLSTLPDDVPSTLVLGMGAGTFTIIVLSVVLSFIWGFSIACELKKKIAFRGISTLLYGVVFIILVFSPRESRFEENNEDLTKIYDESIVPRIAITAVTCLFGLIAAIILFVHLGEKKQLSTNQPELSAFWLEE